MIDNQGQKFLSTPAPHKVVSPWNCLMLALDHPPNEAKSENEADPSQ